MRHGFAWSHRGGAIVLAGLLALALALACGPRSAFADDDDDTGWDVKILRQFLKDLGLQRDGGQIEYRERAPLVVPPSRNLPPPREADAVAANPAWPNDPDVRQRKLESAAKKKPRITSEVIEAEGRPLPRSELDKGRIPPGSNRTKAAPTPEESARPMRPDELKSKSIFSGMFSLGSKTETATFDSEPPRESLTAPPTGYQTPSPNQPYGVGPSNDRGKPTRPEDRMTTYER
jgi:hypothetical protein